MRWHLMILICIFWQFVMFGIFSCGCWLLWCTLEKENIYLVLCIFKSFFLSCRSSKYILGVNPFICRLIIMHSLQENFSHPASCLFILLMVSYVAQTVKSPPLMWETWIWSLCWEDTQEEGMATHPSILAWRIPMERGAWQPTVHGVTKSLTQLSD